jgi:site-specific DNA recombinase
MVEPKQRLVIGNDARSDVNEDLVELIKEAFAIRNQLLSGSDASIEAMTERLGMGKGHLTSLVRLSYLAPGIVRALLEGRQPIELTPTRLLRLSKDLPHDWKPIHPQVVLMWKWYNVTLFVKHQ